MKTIKEKILTIAKRKSVFRAKDVRNVDQPRATLSRMVKSGQLIRVGKGMYSLPDADISENHSIVQATSKYPGGVICLISALYFHGIGTQLPYTTWIMRKDRKKVPEKENNIRFVYSTDKAFSFGVEKHHIEGTCVHVYSPVKTVADCFKYRNKIGLDIAIEALMESWKAKLFTMDELWTAVKVCRIQKTIQPYIEMLVR